MKLKIGVLLPVITLYLVIGIVLGQEGSTTAASDLPSEEDVEGHVVDSTMENIRLNLVDLEGLGVNLDLKALENGRLGLDYDFEHSTAILPTQPGVASSDLDLVLLSRGYISTDQESCQNSINAEARIAGHLSILGLTKDGDGSYLMRRKRVREIMKVLEEIDPFTEQEKGKDLQDELNSILNPSTVRFITIDFHSKYETDQSFENSQYTFGLGVTTDLGVITGKNDLANLLDIPFSLLRKRSNSYVVQMPRFYFGYDYVPDSDIEERKALTDEDSFSRLTFQAAWMTSILENTQLRMTWQIYYEINSPEGIKSVGKEYTSFFEISAGIPAGNTDGAMIFVKYSSGELPPTLEESSNVSVGFRVEF